MSESAESRKLLGIEAFRGVAASVVVLYHSARHLDHAYGMPELLQFLQFGHAGVDLFFVISGFIILHVHYNDIGHPRAIGRYLERRLTRIYPTFWAGLLITILLSLAGRHAFPPLWDVVRSALLLPSAQEPLLGVAWTLQYEIFFYAVFCLLILQQRAGQIFLLCWLALIGLAQLGLSPGSSLPTSLYGLYNVEFFLGMGTAYALRHMKIAAPRALLWTGVGLFLTVAALENLKIISGYSDACRILYGIPAAMMVLGGAAADRLGLIAIPWLLRVLGKASYSIYLFQYVFISIVWQSWLFAGLDKKLPHLACFPALAITGIAGGVIMSNLVEYPLMALIRRVKRAVLG